MLEQIIALAIFVLAWLIVILFAVVSPFFEKNEPEKPREMLQMVNFKTIYPDGQVDYDRYLVAAEPLPPEKLNVVVYAENISAKPLTAEDFEKMTEVVKELPGTGRFYLGR